jgi:hypothetical protein
MHQRGGIMELNKREFEQEIKKALEFLEEIEHHSQDMDTDDLEDFCTRIRMPLERMLKNISKLKEEKF